MSDFEPVEPIDECVHIKRELHRVLYYYQGVMDEAVVIDRERNKLKRENTALRDDIQQLERENAALREALHDIMTESDEQVIWRMARAALQKEAKP